MAFLKDGGRRAVVALERAAVAGNGVPALDIDGELAQVGDDVHAESTVTVAALAVHQALAPALALAEVVEGHDELRQARRAGHLRVHLGLRHGSLVTGLLTLRRLGERRSPLPLVLVAELPLRGRPRRRAAPSPRCPSSTAH
jgi:hypothetical protein